MSYELRENIKSDVYSAFDTRCESETTESAAATWMLSLGTMLGMCVCVCPLSPLRVPLFPGG